MSFPVERAFAWFGAATVSVCVFVVLACCLLALWDYISGNYERRTRPWSAPVTPEWNDRAARTNLPLRQVAMLVTEETATTDDQPTARVLYLHAAGPISRDQARRVRDEWNNHMAPVLNWPAPPTPDQRP